MRIVVRIFLGYFLVVGLAAWFLLDNARDRLQPALRQSMEDTLVDTANLLAELARDEVKAGTVGNGVFARRLEDFAARRLDADIWGIKKDRPNHRIYITDAQGRVLYDSDHLAVGQDYSRWNDVYLTLHGRYGARTSHPADQQSSVMHVAAPIRDGGRIIGVVTVAKPSSAVEPFFEQAFFGLARAGALVLAASLVLGGLLAWGLTRSLGRLVDYARAVGRGERVAAPDFGGGEVGVLGRALEGMRSELDGKRYVEDYVHALTHELKSPLAAIRGAAELIDADMAPADQAHFLGHIRHESARLGSIIDRLLALAQLESRRALEDVEPIALAALLAEAVEAKSAALRAGGLAVDIEAADGLTLRGERFLLGQALSNLLDNAIAFSPAGGRIALSAARAGETVEIRVRDQGPGVPDYALERVFERFYSLPRPGDGRKSTGLGLPFVREVASLHGGRVALANAAGGGALATLALPA